MLVLYSNMNNINVKVLLLECSVRVLTILEYVCLILSAFQYILNVVLEHIKLFNTVQYILHTLIVLLESINLILTHHASIMLA